MSLGHRPKEFDSNDNEALKARFKAKNRAFSASLVGSIKILGRCPRLVMNAAPVALRRIVGLDYQMRLLNSRMGFGVSCD